MITAMMKISKIRFILPPILKLQANHYRFYLIHCQNFSCLGENPLEFSDSYE